MSKLIGYLVAVCVSVFTIGLAAEARAGAFTGSYIDFNVAPNTVGSIAYAGGSSPLTGSGIPVNLVSGGPLNSASPFACTSCTLNFQTGNFDTMTNSFMGGGSITITGGFDPADIPGGSTLLSGAFTGAMLIPTGPTTQILAASFTDTKHPDLRAFFGIPAGTTLTAQGLNIQFSYVQENGSFRSTEIGNSNVVNAAVDTPSSLLLLGTGLAGLAFLRVRNRAGGSLPSDKGPALGEGLALIVSSPDSK